MKLAQLKLVSIIAEAVLKDKIVADLLSCGVSGYSISSCYGEGSRGMRAGEIPGDNLKVESIVEPDTSQRILNLISSKYFDHYAIICFISDVAVLRGDKYRDSKVDK